VSGTADSLGTAASTAAVSGSASIKVTQCLRRGAAIFPFLIASSTASICCCFAAAVSLRPSGGVVARRGEDVGVDPGLRAAAAMVDGFSGLIPATCGQVDGVGREELHVVGLGGQAKRLK
jgi:hypothetical protein